MRRMRVPLIVLILVYSLSVFGMVLVPGQDAAGNPLPVNYLNAAYYVAIMATTVGFGEYPTAFTGAQRFYAMIILFPNVVAWLYAIGTILGLFLDAQFRGVLARARFARRVNRLAHDFFIVCGYGNTGKMIVQALLHRGYSAVVLDGDHDVIHDMALRDAVAHLPALTGDVTEQQLLENAGLEHPHCRGIMAITNDDHANLTIAITSKLLRPKLPVLARSETARAAANMASFGTDYVIDPYAIFAERFELALSSPAKFLLQDWLISVPGSQLRDPFNPPAGRWIVCGRGRFGGRIVQCLERLALPYTVIDIHPDRIHHANDDVLGRGTEAHTLVAAKIHDAVGIVAGTGDDIDNLSIVMTARELNPRLLTVVRQEQQENGRLFDTLGADMVARRSMIVARHILYIVTTPLLATFLQHMLNQDDGFAQRVSARLKALLGGRSPAVWTTRLEGDAADGIAEAERVGARIRLEHVMRHSRSTGAEQLRCFCLLLERGAARVFLPEPTQELHAGDVLLMVGRDAAQREMLWTLSSPLALLASATGRVVPRSALWRYFNRKTRGGAASGQ